jgi:ferredoxin
LHHENKERNGAAMIRQIIHIDEEKCNGCGICANACHEGAIDIVDGKAKLVRENFCDGFGDCLPGCPTGAITFEEREAAAYDEEAVKKSKLEAEKMSGNNVEMHAHQENGCPGSRTMSLEGAGVENEVPESVSAYSKPVSRLMQWPCQIKLLPTKADFYDGAKLLIAADCTAYAYANMHEDFMKGKVTLIGCPKLDDIDYTDKLTEIIEGNNIKSVTIVRMEVPCCGGLQRAAENALRNSGKFIPWQVVTISRNGEILI